MTPEEIRALERLAVATENFTATAASAFTAAGRIPATPTGETPMNDKIPTARTEISTASSPDRIPGIGSATDRITIPMSIDGFAEEQALAWNLTGLAESDLNEILSGMTLDNATSLIRELDDVSNEHRNRAGAADLLRTNVVNYIHRRTNEAEETAKRAVPVDPRFVGAMAR